MFKWITIQIDNDYIKALREKEETLEEARVVIENGLIDYFVKEKENQGEPTYEKFIAFLHPENVLKDKYDEPLKPLQIDERFYNKHSDHLHIWDNKNVKPKFNIQIIIRKELTEKGREAAERLKETGLIPEQQNNTGGLPVAPAVPVAQGFPVTQAVPVEDDFNSAKAFLVSNNIPHVDEK